jgi:hypothetical protein
MDVSEDLRLTANEIAVEVIDAFSALHPSIRMNRDEWADLAEMITREVLGSFCPSEVRLNGDAQRARDLLGQDRA